MARPGEHAAPGPGRALLLSGYDSFDRLLDKLPEALREPLRREFRPLRDLFLLERPARVCVVADDAAPLRPLLSEMLLAPMGEPFDRALRTGAWTALGGRGRELLFLAARAADHKFAARASAALSLQPPDAILLAGCRHSNPRLIAGAAAALLPYLAEPDAPAPVIAVWVTEEGEPGDPAAEATAAMADHNGLARRFAGIHPVRLTFRLRQDGLLENPAGRRRRDPSLDLLLDTLVSECPAAARVSLARATLSCRARQRLAAILTRAASTAGGILGAQPIPIADLPLLTALQIALVAGIARVSGRDLDARLAAEFTAAAGFNIAAATAFRGLARLGLKILPGWGNAISGAIAAAGTTAVGRCASAFFIEEPAPGLRRGGGFPPASPGRSGGFARRLTEKSA